MSSPPQFNDPKKGRGFTEGYNALFDLMPDSGIVRNLMLIAQIVLSPFATVVEVFVRKNMGERFFTFSNFIIGAWIVTLFGLADVFGQGSTWSYWAFSWAFWLLGIYHLIDQWWKSRAGSATHSLSEGESRLGFLSRLFLGLVNAISELAIRFFLVLFIRLTDEEKQKLENAFPVFTDQHSFTLLVIEPVVIAILASICFIFSPPLSSLLLVSMGASFFNNYLTIQMRYHRLLNIRDSMIEAEFMRQGLPRDNKKMRVSESMRHAINDYAEQAKEDPEIMEQIERTSPSIADAMAALNPELRNLGKNDD